MSSSGGTGRRVVFQTRRFEAYFQKEAAEETGEHLRSELDEFCQALPAANYVGLKGSSGFEFHWGATTSDFRVFRTRFQAVGQTLSLEAGASTRGLERTLELLRLLLLSLIPAVIAIACVGGAGSAAVR